MGRRALMAVVRIGRALLVAVGMLCVCLLLAVLVAAALARVLVRVVVCFLGMPVLGVAVLVFTLLLGVCHLGVAMVGTAALAGVRMLGIVPLSVAMLLASMPSGRVPVRGGLLREGRLQCRHGLRLRDLDHRLENLRATHRWCQITVGSLGRVRRRALNTSFGLRSSAITHSTGGHPSSLHSI